jgi:indolepyruvate ferredoxin oxidoreductase
MLHPPILRALGMKNKIAIPNGLARAMFGALRRMRPLRGTVLDPFGHAKVRRIERELPTEYLACVGAAVGRSYEEAVAVAQAADEIRGYEEVKMSGVERFRQAVGAASSAAKDASTSTQGRLT